MNTKIVFLLVVSTYLHVAYSANILGYLVTRGRSHFMVANALMRELATRGHNVTVVGVFPEPKDDTLSNYRYLRIVRNQYPANAKEKIIEERNSLKRRTLLQQFQKYWNLNKLDMFALKHEVVRELLNDTGTHFDLVIFDYLVNDYNVGIAAHFKCPSVVISNHAINMPTRNLVGNPSAAAFTKSIHLDGPLKMDFFARVQNHLTIAAEQMFLAVLDHFRSRACYERFFPAAQGYPSYAEAKRNISLVLLRAPSLQSGPVLTFPTVREVSGLRIGRDGGANNNTLPDYLRQWFDASDQDVIYMSFGTHVNCTQFSEEKREAFMSAFARLNGSKRVLLKWDGDEEKFPRHTPNVRIQSWFPQPEVLAHPKVKVFISHCGLGGITDARNNGVPVLGVPIFDDQFENVDRIVAEGWARCLRLVDLNADTFGRALEEMFADDGLQRRAARASALYRDRMMHPMDEATFWVEYVLRHDGARHMQSEAMHLNWFQYHSLDVYAFLMAVVYVAWKCLVWTVVLIWRRCNRRQSKEKLY